jgi:protein phosphatase PTC6
MQNLQDAQVCGSTASVLLLHSLSTGNSQPFFAAPTLSLTVAHVGDTRILLTTTEALTESHHADARVELARLRRLAGRTGSVVDAFGETRWMGAVENTRALGDGRWKKDGVTAEPQISSRVIDG